MLLFADSFEQYGAGRANLILGPGVYVANGSSITVDVTNARARTGSWSLELRYADNNMLRKSVVLNNNEMIAGWSSYFSNMPANPKKVAFGMTNGSTYIAWINITSSGAIEVYAGSYSSGTLVATTDNIVGTGTFNYFELRVLQDNVVGEIEVRFNGNVVALLTNLNLGTLPINGFYTTSAAGGTTVVTNFDDLYILDTTGTVCNDFLGPVRINTVMPTSDTVEADWAKNTGTDGFALIDDAAPDGDTTYIQAGTVGNISEFGMGTLPASVDTIAGIYVLTMGKLSEAGVGDVETSLVSGASVSPGGDKEFTTNYAYYGSVHPVNPDGNIAWTKTTFEAAKLRFEKTL